jgi:hypothetical protein
VSGGGQQIAAFNSFSEQLPSYRVDVPYRELRPVTSMQILPSVRRFLMRPGPYPSLLMLGAPLAIAEPLKLVAVFVFGEGHFIAGVLMMICAYAASRFVTEPLIFCFSGWGSTGEAPKRKSEETHGNTIHLERCIPSHLCMSRKLGEFPEIDCLKTTNLGVRSSNLFGRAITSIFSERFLVIG